MKRLLSILSLLLSAFFLVSLNDVRNLDELNIKGKVTSITEINYIVDKDAAGRKTETYHDSTVMTFNKAGYLTEEIEYKNDRSIDSREVYFFQNDSLCYLSNAYWSSGQVDSVRYVYEGGKVSEVRSYPFGIISMSQGVVKNIYKGDQKAESLQFSSEGDTTVKTFFMYDSHSVLKFRYSYYNYGGSWSAPYITVFSYDENGRLVKTLSRGEMGTVIGDVTSIYDTYGNETGRIDKGNNGSNTWEVVYEYDSKGNWITGRFTNTRKDDHGTFIRSDESVVRRIITYHQ